VIGQPKERLEVGEAVPAVATTEASEPRGALVEEVRVEGSSRDLCGAAVDAHMDLHRLRIDERRRPGPAPAVVAGDEVTHEFEVVCARLERGRGVKERQGHQLVPEAGGPAAPTFRAYS